MKDKEKNSFFINLYKVFQNKSNFEVLYFEDIKNHFKHYNNKKLIDLLLKLKSEDLIDFDEKRLKNESGKIVDIHIENIKFTEKGNLYYRDLTKNSFVKILSKVWEIIYKYIIPVGFIIDIILRILSYFRSF